MANSIKTTVLIIFIYKFIAIEYLYTVNVALDHVIPYYFASIKRNTSEPKEVPT